MANGIEIRNSLETEIKQAPDISVKKVARGMNMSLSSLYNHWQSHLSPKQYLLSKRLSMALKLLARDKKICEVANELKFCDHIYFWRWFKQHSGISPKRFQLKYGSDFRNGNYDKICQELKGLAILEIPQSGREMFPQQPNRETFSQSNREMFSQTNQETFPRLNDGGDTRDPGFLVNNGKKSKKEGR
jgi:AraC-like DNA-binding protein